MTGFSETAISSLKVENEHQSIMDIIQITYKIIKFNYVFLKTENPPIVVNKFSSFVASELNLLRLFFQQLSF